MHKLLLLWDRHHLRLDLLHWHWLLRLLQWLTGGYHHWDISRRRLIHLHWHLV